MKKILTRLFFIVGLIASTQTHGLNLVWQIQRATCWEPDWLNELLSDFDITHIDDGKHEVFLDNAIVITFAGCPRNSAYFKKLHDMNYKFGVILLSDECYLEPTDYYKYAQFVLRNYWHKQFASYDNVYIFPLGYKAGFWKHCSRTVKKVQERTYIWSFAGQITEKPTRAAMIHALQTIPHYYIHPIDYFAAPNSLPVDAYQNLLLNTIFVPCPTGYWNLDSFRVYEALECGCIPIVEKNPIDYFHLQFGDHPFLAVDSWDEATHIIRDLLCNPIELEQYRITCHQWWLNRKEKIKQDFSTIIKSTMHL